MIEPAPPNRNSELLQQRLRLGTETQPSRVRIADHLGPTFALEFEVVQHGAASEYLERVAGLSGSMNSSGSRDLHQHRVAPRALAEPELGLSTSSPSGGEFAVASGSIVMLSHSCVRAHSLITKRR